MANDYLPFGTAGGANVISQSDYNSLPARLQGFVAGVALSGQLNKVWRQSSVVSAAIGQMISDYGALNAVDDGNVANLVRDIVRTIMDAPWSYVVATGTANAWVATPTPTLAAYRLGRPLIIVAPATNTSTTVNIDVSGLGNRRIKKADGTDPAIGDLVIGRGYTTIDDGTSIRVLDALASDIAPIAASAFTVSTSYTTPGSYTFTASKAGVYDFRLWAAGGGGAYGQSGAAAAGGGGGSWIHIIARMASGNTAAIVLGAPGAGATSTAVNGSNGINASITLHGVIFTAEGGKGALNPAINTAGGPPAAANVVITGSDARILLTEFIRGRTSEHGSLGGDRYGGRGGDSPNGGQGGGAFTGAGSPGEVPGAGGGGGANDSAGGDGAAPRCIVLGSG